MKKFRAPQYASFALVAILATFLTSLAQAADSINIRATLILGSNDGGGVDASLHQYERNLKKVLPFDTFRNQGSSRARVAVPGSNIIGLSGEHDVSVKVDPAGDGKYRISAQWKRSGHTLVNTTVVASKDRPTVLVGPSSGNGRIILLLIAH
ncbi:hypothetical protein IEN85_13440 [Pelagicoccus sp. NFK12]|uniref:Uncharacterized protein n=1 Tax=Pelagicoccus enzymogenes TaxID=2773457 RepID=A0A927FBP4_9BACT|nr:hypothetical protein [Pelagicoccus enzymogenes]MBD5780498.1 hypothetical protein [Pelagicoccus enzymogenes]